MKRTFTKRIGQLLIGLLFVSAVSAQSLAPLTVSGNHVLVGGKQASLAGNSMFWSNKDWGGEKYYNASCIGWLKSDWKSSIVRAAMGVDEGGGYLSDPVGNRQKVVNVVDAAIANNMYVIIDWHSHNAHMYQSQAISFFQDMARTYGSKTNVIYEIYNEPLDVSWKYTIRPYAMAVIAAIRAIDPDNLIVVGTPYYSQKVDEASWDKITEYSNIAYTLHFYSGTHTQYLRNKASDAMTNGIALFVTEWGTVNADGNGAVVYGETDTWMNYLKQNGISHCNWSLNDKAEGASALNPGASATGGWSSANLSASGTYVRGIIKNWGGVTPDPVCTVADITSTIQAEGYCQMSGIQSETTSDAGGGQNIGWIDTDDYMTYSVNVPTAGSYKIQYRVASAVAGGVIQLEKAGGGAVYGTVNVESTGGWQTWKTITQTVTLPAGEQFIAIKANVGGFNLNWWGNGSNGDGGGSLIKTIQAESYASMNGITVESTSDAGGGSNVGYIDANDWMSYTTTPVSIPSTGVYTVEYRVASLNGGGRLQLEEAGGSVVYGAVDIDATGGWQTWKTIKQTVTLTAGTHSFGIKAVTGGWNLNWFSIYSGLKSAHIAPENITDEVTKMTLSPNPCTNSVRLQLADDVQVQVQIIDIAGKTLIAKEVSANDSEIDVTSLKNGIYIVRIMDGTNITSTKLIKK